MVSVGRLIASANTPVPNMHRNKEDAHVGNCGNVRRHTILIYRRRGMSILIEIDNCNNISKGSISLEKEILNIKYGINGTGKSTIAKAIRMKVLGEEVDPELRTFGGTDEANVTLSESIDRVEVFNEAFIENIVFDRNEVIKDSFNIFIKSERYDERVNRLNERLKTLKVDLLGNDDVRNLIQKLEDVSSKLVLNGDGTVKKNPFFKSIVAGKDFYEVPEGLEKFSPFITTNDKKVEWIDWKTKGHQYDEICGCPFCASALHENYESEKETFTKTYKKATANNLKIMLEYFEALEEYICKDKYFYLISCIKEIEDTTTIEFEYQKFVTELYFLINKFNKISQFDSFRIKQSDIGNLNEIIKDLYIRKESVQVFGNEKTLELINEIDENIKKIEDEVLSLKQEIGQIKAIIQGTVRSFKNDINSFLLSAGINYEIDILVNGDNDAVTILKYIGNNSNEEVEAIKNHLSWGEKNAFALILFMFNALKNNPSLIILDDPISSFDAHKKYAIIHRLFDKNKESFYKKTVLMLTHDFEPIIDFIINNKPTGGSVNANFIKNSNGILDEHMINKNDGVDSYIRLLNSYSKKLDLNNISRVVFLRQLIEHLHLSRSGKLGYNLISSLVHGDDTPKILLDGGEKREATAEEVNEGTTFIREYLQDFDYSEYIQYYFNKDSIIQLYNSETCNYLKLQLFRSFIAISEERAQFNDDVLLKFIDEIYHIENDYIYYLDVLKYDVIPDYIINKCNTFIEKTILRGAPV